MAYFLRVYVARVVMVIIPWLCCLWANANPPAATKIPAIFIFGDSLVDAGNNNYLPSLSRANLLPNGIDFPSGATGRFCNGRTALDIICQELGLPLAPPFLSTVTGNGSSIVHGVNFASGGAGILSETGRNFIYCLSLCQQIKYFQMTLSRLRFELSEGASSNLIEKSLFCLTIGSNDYINNYLLPYSKARAKYTPQGFQEHLLSKFHLQLKRLYRLGARKFIITNIGPLGCTPSQLSSMQNNGSCVSSLNHMIISYNIGLKHLLRRLNSHLSEAKFVYANTYNKVLQVLKHPIAFGFQDSTTGCCGAGYLNGQIPCLPVIAHVCHNRTSHLFWDSYHPTEAFNLILGKALLTGGLAKTFPINILQLVQL